MKPCIAAACLVGAAVFAAAAQAPPAGEAEVPVRVQQRAGIEAERVRIEARFDAEMAECQRRFVVTACVDDARKRRREALAAPRAAALALDDLERQERAIARRDAVQARQREAAARGSRAAPKLAAAAPRGRVIDSQPGAAAPAASAPRRPDAVAAASVAERAAQRRASAARARQQEIEATQARIRARQQERLREGKLAAPLPVPAASR